MPPDGRIDDAATATGILDLVLPAIDEMLVPAPARTALRAWAAKRPAIAWIGFEIPLTDALRVDVHQGLRRRDIGAPDRSVADHAADPVVRSVVDAWRRGASAVHNMVLEYDLPVSSEAPEGLGKPAVFAGFDAEAPLPERIRARHDLVAAAGIGPDHGAALDRLEAALAPAWIGHLGVMVSRPGQGLRVNLRDLPPMHIPDLLRDLGQGSLAARAGRLLRGLVDLVDRVVLCIDCAVDGGGAVMAGTRVGIEIAVEGRSPLRWAPVLDHLVANGLCRPERAAAVPGWIGIDTPVSARARWPLEFILDDLRMPAQAIAQVRRYVSHVKLVLDETAPDTAKLYLGAVGEPRPAATLAPASGQEAPTLARAIVRAVAGLRRARGQTGFWVDFTANGCSDEWVSAVIAGSLARAGGDGAVLAAETGAWLMRRRRPGGGWGFDAGRPADADTTVWVLRLLDRLGEVPPAGVVDWLMRHLEPGQGLRTYLPSTMAGGDPLPYGGDAWSGAHLCVTAAAAGYPALAAVCRPALVRAIGDGTCLDGYWWADPAYASALAAEALATAGGEDLVLDRIGRWAVTRLDHPDITRSTFHLALTLRTALAAGHSVTAALGKLLALQDDDGLWPGGADLRIPPATALAAAGVGTTIAAGDDRGLFTTAIVLDALLACQAAGLTSQGMEA